jgi:ketosteroid isomerase-like protein
MTHATGSNAMRFDLRHHGSHGKLTSIREYVDTQALARAAEVDASGPA